MKKRLSFFAIFHFVILLIICSTCIHADAADISKDSIASSADAYFNYMDAMRYRDRTGEYVCLPIRLGSPVGNSDNMKFQGAIIYYDESYRDNMSWNWDEEFILVNKKQDKSMSWVENDMLIIYGKYVGVETYYSTNPYTDKQDPVEHPVIEVYYDQLSSDPIGDWESIMLSAHSHANPSNYSYDDNYYAYDYGYGDPGDTGDYDEYVLYGSDSSYIDKSYIHSLTNEELRIARNEIYARHGRMFNSADLQNYFNSKSWYSPRYTPDEFNAMGDSMLNAYEKANRDAIAAEENSRK
ncbi:YARHG domain-containing protein [Butyrivibrio sp. WCD2001]|uniref:YARHG domain-containing protein n=1 Tax=Butyrivibrio sp. WCD2001 TaxID=1280681 RepID=UPI000427B261|nr:YARHG domain-containing protein [Butyrivibrio sp. WCD2001]